MQHEKGFTLVDISDLLVEKERVLKMEDDDFFGSLFEDDDVTDEEVDDSDFGDSDDVSTDTTRDPSDFGDDCGEDDSDESFDPAPTPTPVQKKGRGRPRKIHPNNLPPQAAPVKAAPVKAAPAPVKADPAPVKADPTQGPSTTEKLLFEILKEVRKFNENSISKEKLSVFYTEIEKLLK